MLKIVVTRSLSIYGFIRSDSSRLLLLLLLLRVRYVRVRPTDSKDFLIRSNGDNGSNDFLYARDVIDVHGRKCYTEQVRSDVVESHLF